MKMSRSFYITRKEFPSDEECLSSKLLVKSGMIFKNDSGIYSYLPMGLKVVNNIKKIIREEMKKNSVDEVLMPSLVESNIFEYSNRIDSFKEEIFRCINRNNKEYVLCPTHEEMFAMLVRSKIKSYKDLHFSLFQLSNKYRDEIKTNYGLVRKKEFCMADAYSFDADEGGLDISYDKMSQVFRNIFSRLELDFLIVKANPDMMNGQESEEFQVLTDYGDNEIVKCNNCNYCTNIEFAQSVKEKISKDEKLKSKTLVSIENVKSIKELLDKYNVAENKIIKSIIIRVDDVFKMVLLKGTSELNVLKLQKLFKNQTIEIATQSDLEVLGINELFIGPINLNIEIIADNEVKSMCNCICGSNMENNYFQNVTPGVDFKVSRYEDLKLFNEKSLCPKCKNNINIYKGIEIGHIFKLETNYSEKYNLKYLDEKNNYNYVHMGSYGIGIDRCISAVVEKYNDEKGIIWPIEIAPYKVAIIIINVNDKETYKYANNLYNKLESLGIDTILDDRKETVGVKFNDMDLIGVPFQIIVGRKLENNKIEYKLREENKIIEIDKNNILLKIKETINL